jgi:site-specific DNA-methyltransferase (adenine-specific)
MKKEKVKKFGEVFTPQFLVDDMLDTLPSDVWTNPNLKWLDPCVGRNAIFPITVYKRLMVSLADSISDITQRDAHIWDNMLYMVELQEDGYEEAIALITTVRKEIIDEYSK